MSPSLKSSHLICRNPSARRGHDNRYPSRTTSRESRNPSARRGHDNFSNIRLRVNRSRNPSARRGHDNTFSGNNPNVGIGRNPSARRGHDNWKTAMLSKIQVVTPPLAEVMTIHTNSLWKRPTGRNPSARRGHDNSISLQ